MNSNAQQQQLEKQQQHTLNNNQSGCLPNSPLAHHNYTWPPGSAPTAVYSNTRANSGGNVSNGNGTYHLPQQSNTTIVKHARASPRPSQVAAPYPSPSCVHQHHNYSSPAAVSNQLGHHSNSNNSANNVLQQLSQQNISLKAHHSSNSQLQQQQQLATVTITSNFSPSQQILGQRGDNETSKQQHQPSSAAITTANNINSSNGGSVGANSGSTAGGAVTAFNHMPVHSQHINIQQAVKHVPNSPNRRTRGENKKCRKVYGMDRRDMWCTQCRWKKACSRFGD